MFARLLSLYIVHEAQRSTHMIKVLIVHPYMSSIVFHGLISTQFAQMRCSRMRDTLVTSNFVICVVQYTTLAVSQGS